MFNLKEQLFHFMDNNSLQFLFHPELIYICVIGIKDPNYERYVVEDVIFTYYARSKGVELYPLGRYTLNMAKYASLIKELISETDLHIIYYE